MVVVRKIIGALIIICFALPTLFGIIWAVGLTKAAVSPEFVSEMPQQIIDEAPLILEEIFEDAQDRDYITNENTRRWFRTAADVGISPRQLMEEIGLLDWIKDELSVALRKVGEVLRGERRARAIAIDLMPLKAALRHGAIDRYLEAILDRLPPCDDRDMDRWMEAYDHDIDWFELPPCSPDKEIALSVFRAERLRALEDMDNEIELFEGIRYPTLGISRSVTLFSYALFLIPALFLFAGAIIAATSPAGLCRWFGISSILGGLPALLLALLAKHASSWAMHVAPFWDTGMSDLEELVLDKVVWIPQMVLGHLFSDVINLAGMVCVIGLVIFALSFVVRGERRVKPKTRPVPMAAPAPAVKKAEVVEKAGEAAPVEEKAEAEKQEKTEGDVIKAEAAEDEASEDEVVEKEKVPLPEPEDDEKD